MSHVGDSFDDAANTTPARRLCAGRPARANCRSASASRSMAASKICSTSNTRPSPAMARYGRAAYGGVRREARLMTRAILPLAAAARRLRAAPPAAGRRRDRLDQSVRRCDAGRAGRRPAGSPRSAIIRRTRRRPRSRSTLPRRFAATAGTAEEVIALQPDLVVDQQLHAAGDARGLCAGRAEDADCSICPTTIAASKAQIAQLAACGRRAGARAGR